MMFWFGFGGSDDWQWIDRPCDAPSGAGYDYICKGVYEGKFQLELFSSFLLIYHSKGNGKDFIFR